MNSDLEKLVTLQAVDLELKHARSTLAAGPARVARAEADRREADGSLAAVRKALLDEEKLRRRQESEADDRRAKLTKLRKQMDTAANAAQVSALEHEIAFAVSAIAKLEDEELESLERTETAEKKEAVDARVAENLAGVVKRVTEETAAAATVLRKTIVALDAERTTVRATVDESVLSVYDRIAKTRGTGLSEAIEHKCSACQMMVRPQRWNDLTGRDHEDEIFHCETCGRMLIWDRRRDAPGPWAAGDRLAAARKLEAKS